MNVLIASESALGNMDWFFAYHTHVRIKDPRWKEWSNADAVYGVKACASNQKNKQSTFYHTRVETTGPNFTYRHYPPPLPFTADLLYPASSAKHFTNLFTRQ